MEKRTEDYRLRKKKKKREKVARFESFLIIKLGKSVSNFNTQSNCFFFTTMQKNRTKKTMTNCEAGNEWMKVICLSVCLKVYKSQQTMKIQWKVVQSLFGKLGNETVTLWRWLLFVQGLAVVIEKKDGKKQDIGKKTQLYNLKNKYDRTSSRSTVALIVTVQLLLMLPFQSRAG